MTTLLSLDGVEVTTLDTGGAGNSPKQDKNSGGPRYLCFPKDLNTRRDPSTESDQKEIPYVLLTIYEVERDNGLPKLGSFDAGDTVGGSLREGVPGVTSILTNPVTLGLISGAVAARLQAGAIGTGAAIGVGAVAGGAALEGLNEAISNEVLGLPKGSTIGGQLKDRLANFSIRRNVEKSKTHIVLPMPENIAIAHDQMFQEIGMTQAMGLPGILAQAYASRGEGVTGMAPYALELASQLSQSIPGVGANFDRTIFYGTTGLVVNPQLEMLFTATGLRRFMLDFRLTPKNKEDAELLLKPQKNSLPNSILSALKYYSAPEIAKTGKSGRYFIPPAQFEVTFYTGNNRKNEYFFKTKKCVLESVAIDYTPNGFVTHEDGTPAQVSLQLTFVESSMLSRNELAEGNIR